VYDGRVCRNSCQGRQSMTLQTLVEPYNSPRVDLGHILSMRGRGLAPVLHSDDAEAINAVKVGLQLFMSSQARFTVIHVKVGRL
jgi:hypothetical protein